MKLNLEELELIPKDKRIKAEGRIYVDPKAIQKYLETKKYLEKKVFPKIKMTFGYSS